MSADAAPLASDQRLAIFDSTGDPHPVAEILCDVLKLVPIDAVRYARQAPGVIDLPLTAAAAERIAQFVQKLGAQTAIFPAAAIPDLPSATVVHHARIKPEAFEVVDYRGDVSDVLPWDTIGLLAIGVVPQDKSRHFPDMGPTVLAPAPPIAPVDLPHAAGPELWLLAGEPVRAFRIDHRQMNYETLGDRKADSATASFFLFARDLAARATAARLTPSTRAYLLRDSASHYQFASSADLQRHVLLHYAIQVSAKRSPEKGLSST